MLFLGAGSQGSWRMDGWQGDSEQMGALMDCSYIKRESDAGLSTRMQETQQLCTPRHSFISTLHWCCAKAEYWMSTIQTAHMYIHNVFLCPPFFSLSYSLVYFFTPTSRHKFWSDLQVDFSFLSLFLFCAGWYKVHWQESTSRSN